VNHEGCERPIWQVALSFTKQFCISLQN